MKKQLTLLAIAFGTMALFRCNASSQLENMLGNSSNSEPNTSKAIPYDGIRYFANCKEVTSYLQKIEEQRNESKPVVADNSGPTDKANSPDPVAEDGIVNQERGVSEGDSIQSNATHAYYFRQSNLIAFDKATLRETSRLTLGDSSLARPSLRGRLLISQSKLIAAVPQNDSSRVLIFDLSDPSKPSKIFENTYKGLIDDMRINEGRFLFTSKSNVKDSKSIQVLLSSESDCQSIVTPYASSIESYGGRSSFVPEPISTLNIAYSVNVDQPSDIQKISILSNWSDQFYISQNKIVTASSQYDQPNCPEAAICDTLTRSYRTFLRQIAYDSSSGRFTLEATGLVDGVLKDRWAIHYNTAIERLFVTTTTNQWTSLQANQIATLKKVNETLQQTDVIGELGQAQALQSIRYVGNFAYIVTFAQQDPLYVVDLSIADHLELKGELHIPGFSSLLLPAGNSHLIGIGFDVQPEDFGMTGGVKVSYFDVGNPTAPTEVNTEIIGTRFSGSEATLDSHASYIDTENKIFALPFQSKKQSQNSANYGQYVYSSGGVKFYDYSQGSLRPVLAEMDFSHLSLMPIEKQTLWTSLFNYNWFYQTSGSLDVTRIKFWNNKFVLISPYGVTAIDPATGNEDAKTLFSGTVSINNYYTCNSGE